MTVQRSPFLTQSVPLTPRRRSLRRVMTTSPIAGLVAIGEGDLVVRLGAVEAGSAGALVQREPRGRGSGRASGSRGRLRLGRCQATKTSSVRLLQSSPTWMRSWSR